MMGWDPVDNVVSRRNFLHATGWTGAVTLAGCTERNPRLPPATVTGIDGGNSGSLSGNINLAGSSTVFPLATAVGSAFNDDHPEVNLNMSSTGTGGGFSNHFCSGRADFNNASRPISPDEKDLCAENGVDWVELTVATDALTVIVNNEADWVDCVTIDELKQIWEPNGADRWNEVRSEWPAERFDLFGPTSASGTFDYFTEQVVGTAGKHRTDYSATEQDRTIIRGVLGSEHALGYLGFAYFSQNTLNVKGLEVDSGDGTCTAPSLDAARSGEYQPLSRPLFTYVAKSSLAHRHVAKFARFFVEQSTNRQLVADRVGYVPNSEETMTTELEELTRAIDAAQD